MNAGVAKDKSRHMLKSLGEANIRLTPARQAVIEVIAGADKPLTPEEVLRRARKLHPSVGLATVYRTLDALEMANCASRVHVGQQAYVIACGEVELHAHLICRVCHRLIECDLGDATARIEQAFAAAAFKPQSNVIEMLGVCGRCGGA